MSKFGIVVLKKKRTPPIYCQSSSFEHFQSAILEACPPPPPPCPPPMPWRVFFVQNFESQFSSLGSNNFNFRTRFLVSTCHFLASQTIPQIAYNNAHLTPFVRSNSLTQQHSAQYYFPFFV